MRYQTRDMMVLQAAAKDPDKKMAAITTMVPVAVSAIYIEAIDT